MQKITLLLLLTFLISCTNQPSNKPIEQLENNWNNYLLNEDIDPEMEPFFFNIKPDGTWNDLDYSNRQKGNWPLHNHLWRTIEMAKAYQQSENKYYKNDTLAKNIHLAYNWWVDNDIVNTNWWYPQIGIPQSIGVIMLLMQTEIDENQWQKGLNIMNRVVFGNKTGQNLVWVSSNIVLRSILKGDTTFVTKATANIRNEMQMANNNVGLQPDYSFHQHGRQLQFGNYGLHFLEDQVKWMFILNNSEYDYTPNQIELMRNYFAEGQRWVIWNNVYDINSSGRQLFPNEQLKKYKRVKKAATEMQTIDPKHKALYSSIANNNKLEGIRHFPFSELSIQRTPNYITSIRMCSSRTKGSESGNGENLSGYYLADGAMYIAKTGQEYFNIYPYWDWRKIPGTTAVQDTAKLPEIGWGSYNIDSHFVGGLTYNNCAITSMQYKRDHVVANKSYFLFPDFTVCMGSGISAQKHLHTTIEQCFSTSNIIIQKDTVQLNGISPPNNVRNIDCLWHQGSGYIINQGNKILISHDQRVGNWSKVLSWLPKTEAEKTIFTLGIDHGKTCKDDHYAYAVFPSMKKEDLAPTYQQQPYKILENTKNTQAVQANNHTAIVFHKAGKIKIDTSTSIQCNSPALVMCQTNSDKYTFSICDPTQKLETIRLSLIKTVNGCEEIRNTDIKLPTGTNAGKALVLNDFD